MGGRGGTSGMTARRVRNPASATAANTTGPSTVSQQAPTTSNVPVNPQALKDLKQMDDAQLAALINSSKGIDMPNMLKDVNDRTQEFVYAAGLNEKPEVLDDTAFDQYLKDNNIPKSEILARSVSPINYTNNSNTNVHMTADDVSDMLKSSKLNYIGGKHGGQVFGAGTYFAMNGGRNTGYGQQTITGVLSKNANVITRSSLDSKTQNFIKSHPQTAKAIGRLNHDTMSIYALAQGYNVIKSDYNNYYNVIDRSALVLRKKDI